MTPRDALEACGILGARTLVPIHYALKPVPVLLQTPGTLDELMEIAREVPTVTVVPLEPGERWAWTRN
jgi:L-ascorbate metabolism protein UlaG (beta-lactamase superfamily)